MRIFKDEIETPWGWTTAQWVGEDIDQALGLFQAKLRARGYTHYRIKLIGRVGGWEVRLRKDRPDGNTTVTNRTTWVKPLSEHLLGLTCDNTL